MVVYIIQDTLSSRARLAVLCSALRTSARATKGILHTIRTAACRGCFAKLDVTRVIWLAAVLPRACCKADKIYKWTNALCMHTLHREIP